MGVLKLEEISKSYGARKILDGVSLEVKSGEVMAILAPTGSGKTTLMRIIAGVEIPDEGKIYLDGEDITELSPKQRRVSMVYQSFALYPNLNAYENIASPLRNEKGLSSAEIDERVRRIASILGIVHLMDRNVQEVSGGEAQRIAFARALVKEAKIILLDEPMTNVDYKFREKMQVELKKLYGGLKGSIMLYATPDPREALSMSTQIALIQNGKVQQYGPTLRVYREPKNITVGSYFTYPSMNLYDCQLIEKGKEYYLQISDKFSLKVTHLKNKLTEDKYTIGIRPCDLGLTREKRNMLTITPTVKLVETMGSESVVHLDHEGLPMRLLIPEMVAYEAGKVEVFFDPSDVYIFGKKSGEFVAKLGAKTT